MAKAGDSAQNPLDGNILRFTAIFRDQPYLFPELDNLPTVLGRDPFPFPPEVAQYVELNDLRHRGTFVRLVCLLRVTLPFPAALTTNRIAKP